MSHQSAVPHASGLSHIPQEGKIVYEMDSYAMEQQLESIQAVNMSKEAIKGIEFDMNPLPSVTEYFIKAGVTKYNSSWFSRLM
jgi:hypothetical protein